MSTFSQLLKNLMLTNVLHLLVKIIDHNGFLKKTDKIFHLKYLIGEPLKINKYLIAESEYKLRYFNQLPFQYSSNYPQTLSHITLVLTQYMFPSSRIRK